MSRPDWPVHLPSRDDSPSRFPRPGEVTARPRATTHFQSVLELESTAAPTHHPTARITNLELPRSRRLSKSWRNLPLQRHHRESPAFPAFPPTRRSWPHKRQTELQVFGTLHATLQTTPRPAESRTALHPKRAIPTGYKSAHVGVRTGFRAARSVPFAVARLSPAHRYRPPREASPLSVVRFESATAGQAVLLTDRWPAIVRGSKSVCVQAVGFRD